MQYISIIKIHNHLNLNTLLTFKIKAINYLLLPLTINNTKNDTQKEKEKKETTTRIQ